ncbi:MAG: preprotein translocase subunit SecE [Lachnospiraceae bacterium]|nr:preprotein translocase subunit SecE [Lachnospiraceae bacterium]
MADTQKKPKKNFFKGVRSEFKKISWPGRDDVIKQTVVVTIITFVVALIIAAVDFGIKYGINFLTGL